MQDAFSHIEHWVFDLDETLYSPELRLFDQIKELMTEFVQEYLNISAQQANELRLHYWNTYGTTLAGLMAEHDMKPEPFMTHVHEISLDHVAPDFELSKFIKGLNGEAIVYTNGSETHARRVSKARGLSDCFVNFYGVEHANYVPKPRKEAFESVFALAGVDPTKAVMVEDDPRNLVEPHNMGMTTVLVGSGIDAPYVDFQTEDLTQFLGTLTQAKV